MKNSKLKLSNKLLINYIIVIAIAGIFTVALCVGYIMYGFFDKSSNVILDDGKYEIKLQQSEEIDKIISYGGFYEVIDENLMIVYEKNSNNKSGYQYSMIEFLKVIITERRGSFDAVVKFDLTTDNIVMVGLPENVQDISISVKKFDKAGVEEFIKRAVFTSAILFIIISILVYAKVTSKTFVKPIMDLLQGFEKMKNGDYTTRMETKDSVREFSRVKEAFNHMAKRIQEESDLKNKSEKVRKQMILDISHDLKNPLTSIQGYSEFLIKNDNLSREKNLEILKTINKNSIRANRLINELFQYSKLQNKKYTLEMKKEDISELVREVAAAHISMMEDKGMKYEISAPEEVITNFDWKEMDRAISNILGNAIKYNDKGTNIYIKLKENNELIIITVKDDGVGIPEEFKKNIFEPFVRVDESRNSDTGGTGLGLAIASNIISRHNGKIRLKDSFKGCEFEIILPKS